MLVNRHSDFLALGFFIGVDSMGDIGLLSVNPPGVESLGQYQCSIHDISGVLISTHL